MFVEGCDGLLLAILEDVKLPLIQSMNGVAPFAHHHVHQDQVRVGAQNGWSRFRSGGGLT